MATPSVTTTSGWPRLAAPDRHRPRVAVPLALSTLGRRRPASTMHDHPTAVVTEWIA
jgi:hypothetical protein